MPAPKPGHVAVVTGASSGIGAEIAREFARRGHELVLVARSADEAAVARRRAAHHGARRAWPISGTRLARGLLGELESRGLTPQILVNNAGFSTLGPVHSSDPEVERSMIELDVAALADLCSRFLPGMVERGSGAVLNVASTAAFQPLPGQAGYGAAKAFVLSYTRSISASSRAPGSRRPCSAPARWSTGFGQTAGFTDGGEESRSAGVHVGPRHRGREGGRRRAWTRARSWSSPVWLTGLEPPSPT